MPVLSDVVALIIWSFFFQAEDGIRDLVRSRGLGDVYKRQWFTSVRQALRGLWLIWALTRQSCLEVISHPLATRCLLYTSDAADERSSVDLGGRRIIKKKSISKICIQTHTSSRSDHILTLTLTTTT